ncbi:MAG TPA: efflux RND transporter periplasmic adaptor subunit [Stellaceae bacterium]|nr:efflux RND transporter periplasmic adaptor subunit [Stellaceae bacterium]
MVKKSIIALAVLALCAALAGWQIFGGGAPAKAEAPPPSIPVTVGTAEAKDVPVYLRGLGTVQANNTVAVKSRVDGQIQQVFFKEGQEVKAGDRLFQIDPRPYQAALDQAEAAKQKDEAQLAGAQRDLDRYSKLVGQGYQTRQSYDDQKALVQQLQGAIKADEAAIEGAKLNLTYADIRAPISGRTGALLVDPGNLIQASQGTSLVTITEVKPIEVSFTLPQDELDAIRQNQAQGSLTVLAYSSDDKTLLSRGELTLIDNQIDTATGTIRLKATFDNADERLWPGEFVNVRLILSVRKNAVTVPAQTALQGPQGYFLYVVKPDDTVERREVEIAATQDGMAVIAKGVAAGEKVVTDGQYRLTPGAKVRIAPAQPAASG